MAEAQRISQSVGSRGRSLERQADSSSRRAAPRSAECQTGNARCTHQHPSIAPSLRRRLLPPFQANQRWRGSGGSFVEAASKQRLARSEPSISRATHTKLRCSHRLLPLSAAAGAVSGRTWMQLTSPARLPFLREAAHRCAGALLTATVSPYPFASARLSLSGIQSALTARRSLSGSPACRERIFGRRGSSPMLTISTIARRKACSPVASERAPRKRGVGDRKTLGPTAPALLVAEPTREHCLAPQ